LAHYLSIAISLNEPQIICQFSFVKQKMIFFSHFMTMTDFIGQTLTENVIR